MLQEELEEYAVEFYSHTWHFSEKELQFSSMDWDIYLNNYNNMGFFVVQVYKIGNRVYEEEKLVE